VLKIVDNLERRSDSDLFVVLVTGLVRDIQQDLLLNYYSADIFYNNITYTSFMAEMTNNISIDDSTAKKMWYDDTYGFDKL
jgi:hypothetical protein